MDLRLIVITDRRLAAPRPVIDVVRACLEAGAPAVQLRDKDAVARDLLAQAHELRGLTADYNALLFINDRVDVALAAGADGVHIGPGDLPVDAVRRAVARPFLIGYSTDDARVAAHAHAAGADYIGCGAVFGTSTKREAAGERIGLGRLAQVAAAVPIPVVAIGGITSRNVAGIPATGAAGVAVVADVMAAPDPAAATRALLEQLGPPPRR